MIRIVLVAFLMAIGSARATTTILPNNAGILYSPYTWQVSSSVAISGTPGSYLRTLFTGSSLQITVDTSTAVAPCAQYWYRVDGTIGTWTKSDICTATTTVTMPTQTTTYAYHLLEIINKSKDFVSAPNSWTPPTQTSLNITGLVLDAGGTVTLPGRRKYNIIVYGDSITEGVRTISQNSTPDGDDASVEWSYNLGPVLDAEVGVVGWGAQGWVTTGTGAPFNTSWNFYLAGQSRVFTPAPDMVVINEGQNFSVTAAQCEAVLNAMFAVMPNTRIVLMRPFSGNNAAAILACSTGTSIPGQTYYMDTTGFYGGAADGGDGVHPTGPDAVGVLTPLVAAPLLSILNSIGGKVIGGGL